MVVWRVDKGTFYTSDYNSSLGQALNDMEIEFWRLPIKQIQLGGEKKRLTCLFPSLSDKNYVAWEERSLM